jgi:Ni/Fe-hydrogenase subunit HybB-like protein
MKVNMTAHIHVPKLNVGKRQIDVFPLWLVLLGAGLAFGLTGAFIVLRDGLQVTGLSNQVPWGLWISIDLSSISLGGSAFVFGVIVYLLRIKRMEAIGKLSVLLGFLGYSTAGMILLFDLGQPLRFWHPVVFWQAHSLLWEVTMCVVLYLSVLMAELLPVVLEHPVFSGHSWLTKFPLLGKAFALLHKIAHLLHSFGPLLAIAGLTLSLLHQASLGATYSVLAGRGMWFNQSAPVQFVLSAMGGGIALLFFMSVIVFRVMRPGLVSDDTLFDVARLSGGVTLLFIYLRMWDWAVANYYSFDMLVDMQTRALDTIAPFSLTFWLGQILLPLVGASLMLAAGKIRNFRLLMIASILPMFTAVLMRWNYNFSGLIASITYDPFTPAIRINNYAPSWVEFAVGTLVICYWLLMFSLAARFLPFQGKGHAPEHGA